MGLSHLYESCFYGNPSYAFIKDSESITDQIVVIAHCIGHGDFTTNNALYKYSNRDIVRIAIQHAEQISRMETLYGERDVEEVLDLLFGISFLIDPLKPLYRSPYPEPQKVLLQEKRGEFDDLIIGDKREERWVEINTEFPPYEERDLIWFLYQYADLPTWKKDILRMFREEMIYASPIIRTRLMNEGWAAFIEWLLLSEADERLSLFDEREYVDLLKTHTLITSVIPSTSLSPYALGFVIWRKIYRDEGENLEPLLEIRKTYEDMGFVRDFLDTEIVESIGLFEYQRKNAITTVTSKDMDEIKRRLLMMMSHSYNPNIYIPKGGWNRSSGELTLHFKRDTERDLDLTHAEQVLKALSKFWGHKLILEVEVQDGKLLILEAEEGQVKRRTE
jgi:stage V sporulation protein R